MSVSPNAWYQPDYTLHDDASNLVNYEGWKLFIRRCTHRSNHLSLNVSVDTKGLSFIETLTGLRGMSLFPEVTTIRISLITPLRGDTAISLISAAPFKEITVEEHSDNTELELLFNMLAEHTPHIQNITLGQRGEEIHYGDYLHSIDFGKFHNLRKVDLHNSSLDSWTSLSQRQLLE
ncbi:hypothetical protein FRB96_005479 [Tulasnella sp. 330]|nr:hypothetical protein FRB96_005479 [Tulasnella sp. 330]